MNARLIQWHTANQDHLMAAIEVVRARLEAPLGIERDIASLVAKEEEARKGLPSPSGLQQIEEMFRLNRFERELLLLCAGTEILPDICVACAELHRDPTAAFPTFALALSYLSEPSWLSVTPEGPLRQYRLLELVDGPSLTKSRLRIPERVLHFLCGIMVAEPSLEFVEAAKERRLVPSHEALAEEAGKVWRTAIQTIVLCGDGALAVAIQTARKLKLNPFACRASDLPEDLADFIQLWNREAVLRSAALMVEVQGPETAAGAISLAHKAQFPLLIASKDDLRVPDAATFEVPVPTTDELLGTWRQELGGAAVGLNGKLEALANQFHLTPDDIRDAGIRAQRSGDLWAEARKQARQTLDGLAQRIESKAVWKDIVLPDAHLATLHQIEAHVRQRSKVYHAWGFADKSSRGLAISALFAGPSGTGKTLASEVLAGALNLDLYRIDLSQIVSKYIGETEKNLRRIFEAAEGSGAVLLFDEADALFGKRSDVKDSHDRYANIEVAYLLQRMESYNGLVILTTNLRNTLDPAFMRRIRFMVQFPFPEYEDRRRIWQSVFPCAVPLADIDHDRLATLSLAGGSIRNIALNAAFLAADEGSPVTMSHMNRAARSEFAKLERPMTELEGAI